MSTVTLHPTKQSALIIVDALNSVDAMRPSIVFRDLVTVWTYSVVQNAGGHWIVQIHDENDEFAGTL